MKTTFIFDLDGTLLNSKKQFFPETIASLQALANAGHTIIIATGRNHSQLHEFIEPLSMVTYFITLNGGGIFNSKTHKIEFISQPLDQALVHEVVKLTQQVKRELQFSNYDRLYRVYFGHNITEDIQEVGFFKDATKNPKYDLWQDVKHLIVGPVIRIAIRCEKNIRESLYTYLYAKYDINHLCHVEQSSNAYIECDPCNVSKMNTVKLIMQRLHLDLHDTYVFGDSDNDLCLFDGITNSVCMGNSQEYIKARAKYVIDDNNTIAISNFLKSFI